MQYNFEMFFSDNTTLFYGNIKTDEINPYFFTGKLFNEDDDSFECEVYSEIIPICNNMKLLIKFGQHHLSVILSSYDESLDGSAWIGCLPKSNIVIDMKISERNKANKNDKEIVSRMFRI